MKASIGRLAVAVAIAVGAPAGIAAAQDSQTVINQRQDLMKRQGRDLTAVKAFVEGKGDQAAAQRAADDLVTTTIRSIPGLFPQNTSSAAYPGKTRAKPVIWTDWNGFEAAQQNALTKAQALNAAVNTNDKAAIQTALTDLLNKGCSGCHDTFREPQRR